MPSIVLGSKDNTELTGKSRVSRPRPCRHWLLTPCYGDGPVHCRVCGSVPALYPLDANRNPPAVTRKNISRHLPPLGEGVRVKSSSVENCQSREKRIHQGIILLDKCPGRGSRECSRARGRASSLVQGGGAGKASQT